MDSIHVALASSSLVVIITDTFCLYTVLPKFRSDTLLSLTPVQNTEYRD